VAVIAVGALLVLRGDAFESPPDVVAERDTGRSAEPLDQALPLADGTFGEELAPGERDRVRQRLAMYLNSHNRFSDAGEMPHVMPGSRLVAFNAAP
jgi:hypothetical protein